MYSDKSNGVKPIMSQVLGPHSAHCFGSDTMVQCRKVDLCWFVGRNRSQVLQVCTTVVLLELCRGSLLNDGIL